MDTKKATKNLNELSQDVINRMENEVRELDKRSSFNDFDKLASHLSSKKRTD